MMPRLLPVTLLRLSVVRVAPAAVMPPPEPTAAVDQPAVEAPAAFSNDPFQIMSSGSASAAQPLAAHGASGTVASWPGSMWMFAFAGGASLGPGMPLTWTCRGLGTTWGLPADPR